MSFGRSFSKENNKKKFKLLTKHFKDEIDCMSHNLKRSESRYLHSMSLTAINTTTMQLMSRYELPGGWQSEPSSEGLTQLMAEPLHPS